MFIHLYIYMADLERIHISHFAMLFLSASCPQLPWPSPDSIMLVVHSYSSFLLEISAHLPSSLYKITPINLRSLPQMILRKFFMNPYKANYLFLKFSFITTSQFT